MESHPMMPTDLSPDRIANRVAHIVADIKYKYKRVVIVWCPRKVLNGDFVASLASRYGTVKKRQDRWIASASKKGTMEWAGMALFYLHQAGARRASKSLPMESECLRTYLLRNLVNDLANIESRHRNFRQRSTEVVVTCRNYKKKHRRKVRRLLQKFGKLRNVKYGGNTVEAKFEFLTHAYLAFIILNQMTFHKMRFTASMKKSSMQEDIIRELKRRHFIYS